MNLQNHEEKICLVSKHQDSDIIISGVNDQKRDEMKESSQMIRPLDQKLVNNNSPSNLNLNLIDKFENQEGNFDDLTMIH